MIATSDLGTPAFFHISHLYGVVGLCSTGFDWGDTSHLGMSAYFHMSNRHGVVGL